MANKYWKSYQWILLLALIVGFKTNAQKAKVTKPNVILILADDMGVGDISALNGGLNHTPHLDQLIEQSVYFSNAYAGSAVCTPSRASLLTGKYPHRTGAITLNMKRYPELSRIHADEITMADVFKENGYTTGIIGKWHVGDGESYHPLNRGFDEFEGFKGYDVPNDYFNYRLDINGKYRDFNGEYLTENLTKRAVDFITRHKEEPFFLHLAHYAPHRPLSAPKKIVETYLNRGYDEDTATVYAMIEVMDKGIGELLHVLDKEGIRENTVVIFASDNGPDPLVKERFNLNQKGTKYTIYEGGIHVPLLFNWKGELNALHNNALVHFTDILPTLMELCGLSSNTRLNMDGASFSGILRGSNSPTSLPKYRFWQWNRGVPYYSHNAALRDGDWKLVRPYVTRNLIFDESNQKPMLFNIKDDPREQNDLSAREKERYQIMMVKLNQLCRELEFDRLSKNRK